MVIISVPLWSAASKRILGEIPVENFTKAKSSDSLPNSQSDQHSPFSGQTCICCAQCVMAPTPMGAHGSPRCSSAPQSSLSLCERAHQTSNIIALGLSEGGGTAFEVKRSNLILCWLDVVSGTQKWFPWIRPTSSSM